jgi:ElaB/YqjD/DUF883 family membrane-anchored ribosome-binding protein
MAKDTIEEKQNSALGDARATLSAAAEEAFEETGEALHGLRSAIYQASHSLRELGRAGEDWAKGAKERALENGKEWREQGGRALGGVTRQVEQNPLASLGIAFALGFLCAVVARR